jgi:glycosyltransferase involved in cell wall biosynthesis
LKALKILRDAGHEDIIVVSTGNTSDYRAPGYFEEIKAFIKDNNLENNYKILGLIPYDDVQALAEQCHAYINPSLFEGWSTTVEEAKYRGKCIILSELKVHREQNPKHGIFFDPHDEKSLAEKMWEVWCDEPIQESQEMLVEYNNKMRRKFAERFEQIIWRLLDKKGA